MIAWLAACGAPISNAPFYEDEAFLAAVPSSAELTVPPSLLDGPSGDSAVLAGAEAAAVDLDALLAPLAACGDEIRAEPADVRSDVDRGWTALTVAADTALGVKVWYVDAHIVRPTNASEVTWTLTGSTEADGDYVDLASGSYDGEASTGAFLVDLGAFGGLLGVDLAGQLEGTGSLVDGTPETELVLRPDTPGPPAERAWVLFGDLGLGFTGTFDLTGEPLAGYAVAAQTADGGRAQGTLSDDLAFETCWNAAGDTVWLTVADDASGDESACAIGAF